MAGIGIRLNRIFNKNSIAAKLFGFGYSVVVTIAPMLMESETTTPLNCISSLNKLVKIFLESVAGTVIFFPPFLESIVLESNLGN